MRTDLRVLVVGAGIAGLSAARALRQCGIAADVVERATAQEHDGAGIYLPGNATRALDALGLKSAVTERAALIPRQRFFDHRGRLLTDIDLAALWGDVGECLALHRADLHQVLAVHDNPVPVRMGVSLQGLSQQGHAVTVAFDNGDFAKYDLVVGADGIHSTVRQHMLGAGSVRPVGQIAWRFVTGCPPEVTTWSVWLGRGATFLAVPVGDGQVYCYCDASADHAPWPSADTTIEHLRSLLAGFAAPVQAMLETLEFDDAIHVAPIEEVALEQWFRGSVLLLGDAAHATSPNMAEGAAMAMEDGLVLAERLTAEADIDTALASFQTRRRRRTQWLIAQTHRRDRTRKLPPIVRNLVLRSVGRQIFHANYRPLLDAP